MLTKSDFMSFLRCPVELWLKKYQPDLVPETSAELQRIFDTGNEIDFLARDLYPSAALITGYNAEGWENTQKAMSKGAKVLIQPTAMSAELTARADILTQGTESGTWDIREVKSTTKVKKEHIPDLAFQKICFEQAGIKIGKTFLVHLNNKYIRQGDIDVAQLLTTKDVTAEVEAELEETRQKIAEVTKYLEEHKDFSELLIQSCKDPKKCQILGACIAGHPEIYGIADKLPKKYLIALIQRGLLDPSKLSDDLKKQIGYSLSIPFHEVDIELIKDELERLIYPLYFIDYETHWPAIPPFDGFVPYQQIPFQYSLFVQESRNSELKFMEFLALDFQDPIPRFLAHLAKNMGPVGSVLVWNDTFEKTRNREMAKMMPEYKEMLLGMNSRMFDLMQIFKFSNKLYTHSDFDGQYSLKVVLPVLFPELSYDNLAIQDGGTASASWLVLTDKNTPEADKKKLAGDMLEYCKRDTFAMVKILEHLYEKIK